MCFVYTIFGFSDGFVSCKWFFWELPNTFEFDSISEICLRSHTIFVVKINEFIWCNRYHYKNWGSFYCIEINIVFVWWTTFINCVCSWSEHWIENNKPFWMVFDYIVYETFCLLSHVWFVLLLLLFWLNVPEGIISGDIYKCFENRWR